jgi:lipopolysaccharide export system permease protein
MTFGICLFIILMQFLWKYIDEMVGKGIDISILAEMFFYAALSFVPTALPLAILLASLMTFGNLGEQSELLAMKAAGISLFRIMKPLTIFLCLISIGAFYFQNNIIPLSQVKMYTLLHSMKQKSPELEIPESTFYNEIMGYNLYVKEKDRTGLLKELMIYDYSEGFNNAQVIMADSGRLKMSTNKLFLVLSMYNGEAFENLKDQTRINANNAVPYRRETFKTKDILIKYDANFNRANESMMQNRYVGKNLASLRSSIDSMKVHIDSVKQMNATQIYNLSYRKTLAGQAPLPAAAANPEPKRRAVHFDRLYREQSPSARISLLSAAKTAMENTYNDFHYRSTILAFDEKEMRRHHTEMHQKFTLSFACLIFFFIGAPLGAIIRKGGLGMPVVISVLLFIFYYIINNMGFKMASNGMWLPWQGMWLSSAVLLPLGVFLTYKAANDSVILNADTYIEGLKKLIGKRMTRKVEKKEIIMYQVDYAALALHINALKQDCELYLAQNKRWAISYFAFWKQGGQDPQARLLSEKLEQIVEQAANSEQNLILNKLMDYPILSGYRLTRLPLNGPVGRLMAWFFPIGIPVYLFIVYRRRWLLHDVRTIRRVSNELLELLR